MSRFGTWRPFRARTHRGQMLIIVAAAMVVLIAVLGLAIDLGYGFVQRRTMQNAADAGALAGAELITTWSSTNNISVASTVRAIVAENQTGPVTPTMAACNYVSDNGSTVGDCTQPVPSTATGVKVTTAETHATFFIRAVPGAPQSMTTSATSTANVYRVTNAPSDGPFIVCGTVNGQFADSSKSPASALAAGPPPAGPSGPTSRPGQILRLASFRGSPPSATRFLANNGNGNGIPTPTPVPSAGNPTPTVTPSGNGNGNSGSNFNGSAVPILMSDDSINPTAVGQTYVIHDGNPHSVNDCGAGSSFKGLADQNADTNATVPGTWYGDTGTRAGPTRFQVSGLDGCQDNASSFDNCVLLLPVADWGAKQGGTVELHVVAVAAFLVYSGESGAHPRPAGCTQANCHVGTLIGQYVIGPDAGWPPQPVTGWVPGVDGVLMVRVTH